jgi:predicted phosphodiesterase
MKFAISSDLHLDVNNDFQFELTSDKNAFCLFCGDIAGFPSFRKTWLEEQAKRGYHGAFVLGNHQIYHTEKISMQDMHAQLREEFNDYQNGFKFLENDSIYFQEENILLIGCTLWTDFEACGHSAELCGKYAQYRMNDYRWRCLKHSKWLRKMCWQDTARFHSKSMDYIRKTIDKYKKLHPGIKIIIMTHHAPSLRSVSSGNKNYDLIPAYVSKLDDFILDNPEIKLWCHGHLHQPSDYKIGECWVVCNPRGYIAYGEGRRFDDNLVIEI